MLKCEMNGIGNQVSKIAKITIKIIYNTKNGYEYSKFFNYADNTSISHSVNDLDNLLENLEEDAKGVLKFMALNGLVANPNKTEFVLLNSKESEILRRIRVGELEIEEVKTTKLL